MSNLSLRLSLLVFFIVVLAFAANAAPAKTADMNVSFVDELADIFPDTQVPEPPVHSYTLDIPRGAIAGVHLILNNLEEKQNLTFSIACKGKKTAAPIWYRLIDVPVEQNTGLAARLGTDNPHVIRKAPFRVYDALEPIGSSCTVNAPTTALRLEIPAHINSKPGQRKCTINLKCGKQSHSLTLNLNIYKIKLPTVGANSLPYTNWFSLDNIAKIHNLKPFSEQHWTMIEKYAELMARSRQNTFWFPLDTYLDKQDDGSYILDRKRLRRLVDIFTKAGMYYIEGGHLAFRTDGAWASKTFSLIEQSGKGPVATSRQGNKILAHVCKQLMQEIQANNWQNRWLQHIADEPIESHMTEYRIISGMARKYMPGIPIIDANMEATMGSIQLYGSQDIWCPKPNFYEHYRDAYEEMRSLGDKIWFYTCLDPRGPFLNRLMDQERMRPMLIGWGASLYDLDGFLHWGFNHYHHNDKGSLVNPFEQTIKGNLPPGDTHVVYPGPDGPWSSTRLEAHRIGFEDYELLKILKTKDPTTADRLIKKLIRNFSDYTKDTQLYRQVRRQLLTELDRK